ncbi:hypothetical protein GPX89_30430 [Nocardia sp. ET3-3]|uniref:NAD(+)--protein-arginine ADP-ribosyltransferase n=1 Tax=Nocardia terrae TaxID=2675851 RepID=A0A7K1V4I0_9NOCA|nr:toxin glutamine deamidase domain-containing protein [Nocardia terrae]MVU81545.1 hypothetical protein [Nocardia terrae]
MTLTRPPVPGILLDFLAGHWPEGDEDAMRRLAEHWSTMSSSLQALQQPAEASMNDALSAIDGHIHDAMTTYWQEIAGGDAGELAKLIAICDSFDSQLEHGATDVEFAKYTIYGALIVMVAMLAVPFGGIADLAGLAAVKLLIRQTIIKLIGRLAFKGSTALAERAVLKMATSLAEKAALRLALSVGKNAAIGAGIGSGIDLGAQGVQVAQGHRDGIDWGQVGTSAGAGALAGGIAGPIAEGIAPAVGKLGGITAPMADKIGTVFGDKAAGITTAAVSLTGQGVAQIPGNLVGNAAASTTLSAATGQPVDFTHVTDGAGGGFLGKPHGGAHPGEVAAISETGGAPAASVLPAHGSADVVLPNHAQVDAASPNHVPADAVLPNSGAHGGDSTTLAASAAAPADPGTSLGAQPHSPVEPAATPGSPDPAPHGGAGPTSGPGHPVPAAPTPSGPTLVDRAPSGPVAPGVTASAPSVTDRPVPSHGTQTPATTSVPNDRALAAPASDRAPAATPGDRGLPSATRAAFPGDRAVPVLNTGDRLPVPPSSNHPSETPLGDHVSSPGSIPDNIRHTSGTSADGVLSKSEIPGGEGHPQQRADNRVADFGSPAGPVHPGAEPPRHEPSALPVPGNAADRYWPKLPVEDKPYFANPAYHDPAVAHEYAQHHPGSAEARDIRARNAAQHPELGRLSDPEIDLIRRNQYMTLNEPLNRAARDGESALLARHDLELRALVNAYNKLPDHQGVVFRSLRIDDPAQLSRFLDYYDPNRPGPVTVDPGFASSDKSASMAGGNIELVIKSQSGKDISWASLNQDEVVFAPGTRFLVEGRSFEPGTRPYEDKYVINLIDLGRGHDAYQSGGDAAHRLGETRPDAEAIQEHPRVPRDHGGDGRPQSGTERPGPPRTDRGTEEDLASLGRGGTAEDRTGDRGSHGVTPHPAPNRELPEPTPDRLLSHPAPDHVQPDQSIPPRPSWPTPAPEVPAPQQITPDPVAPRSITPEHAAPETPVQPVPDRGPTPGQASPYPAPQQSPQHADAAWLHNRAPESLTQPHTPAPPRPEPVPPHRGQPDHPAPEHAAHQRDPQPTHPLDSILPSWPRDSVNQANAVRQWRDTYRPHPPENGRTTPVRPDQTPTAPPTFDFSRHTDIPGAPIAMVRVKVAITHDGTLTPDQLLKVWEKAQLATDITFNRGQKLLSGDTLVLDLVPAPDPTTANLHLHLTNTPGPWHPDAPLAATARELRTHLGLDPTQNMAPLTHLELRHVSDDIAAANTPARFRGLDGTRAYRPKSLSTLEDPVYQHAVRDALRDGNRFLIGADPRTNPYGVLINDGGPHQLGRSNDCVDNALAALASFHGDPQVAMPRWPDLKENGTVDTISGEANGSMRAARFLGGKWEGVSPTDAPIEKQFADLHERMTKLGPGSSAYVINGWHAKDGVTGEFLYEPNGSPVIRSSHATVVVYPHDAKGPVWWDPQQARMTDHPPQQMVDRSAGLAYMITPDERGGAHAPDPHPGTSRRVPESDLPVQPGMGDPPNRERLDLHQDTDARGDGSGPGSGPSRPGDRFGDREGTAVPEYLDPGRRGGLHPQQADRPTTDGRPDLPVPGADNDAPNPGDSGNDRVPHPNRFSDRTSFPANGIPGNDHQTSPVVHSDRLDPGARDVLGGVPESPDRSLAGTGDVRAVAGDAASTSLHAESGPRHELTVDERTDHWRHLEQLEHRYPDDFDGLQRDPDKNGGISDSSKDEARVGLDLREQGRLPDDIRRPAGASQGEFESPGTRRFFDIKGLHSDWPPFNNVRDKSQPFKGAYDPARRDLWRQKLHWQIKDLKRTVIIDTRNANQAAIDDVRRIVEENGWEANVIWYP